uniref:Aa_trans domain-containing protein n=1 Tax=Elaeophora elaphi TaxID=1147741 RepID=A0A0R3RKB9_9BILA
MTREKTVASVGNFRIESGKSKNEKHRNEQGLGWIITSFFIVGDLAGGGIVALPAAIVVFNLEFFDEKILHGLIMNTVMALAMTYTAHMLGLSWTILQRRWPEYREHCRKPYPEMGARAMGNTVKHIVSVCIDITQFGIAVVYLILSAKNISDFMGAFFKIEISFCYVILAVGLCLLPVTFLKSPQDFWWAIILAMITTTLALIMVMIGAVMDYSTCSPERAFNTQVLPTNYFLALGTVLFSYGGHAAFPTILHDMRKPYHFTRSSILAFLIVYLLYTPVCILAYMTYGNSLRESILNSVQNTALQQGANVLITLHCVLTLTIVFNPLNQEAEEIFGVPHHFCWQRVLVRTGMMLTVVFVAESLPSFGPLLGLVGSSTLTLTALIFPCLFYLYLTVGDEIAEKQGKKKPAEIPSFVELRTAISMMVFVIEVTGLIGGALATYTSIKELATTRFTEPCYIQPFLSLTDSKSPEGYLNCCGAWQNISRLGDNSDCNPYFNFYGEK